MRGRFGGSDASRTFHLRPDVAAGEAQIEIETVSLDGQPGHSRLRYPAERVERQPDRDHRTRCSLTVRKYGRRRLDAPRNRILWRDGVCRALQGPGS